MIGTWAQRIAMGWLVYRLTGSVWMLGLLGFSSGISMFLLAPFGGVLSDVFDRRRLLFITQWLMLAQAVALVILVWSDAVRPWHLISLAILLGTISAFDTPVRQSLISQLLTNRANIGNAIALNSLLMNSARVLGPSMASVLLTAWGETACFALNAVSFFFMLYALHAMDWKQTAVHEASFQLQLFTDGAKHAWNNPALRRPLAFAAVVSFTAGQYPTLMPAIVETLYKGGPARLGVLMSCSGIGAILSALMLARHPHAADLPKFSIVGGLSAGLAMTALALVDMFWVGAALMVFVGGGMIASIASTNTWLQNTIDESYRGRIMGLFAMAAFGMQPFGSIVSGAIGTVADIRCILLVNGLLCAGGAVIYASRRSRSPRAK
jgi:MFS family permease